MLNPKPWPPGNRLNPRATVLSAAVMAVCPGDLVIGDADGVITIPAADAAALLPRVKAHADREAKTRAKNLSGTTDPERFNAPLRAKGCPV